MGKKRKIIFKNVIIYFHIFKDEMENQLNQVDNLVEKDPKKALGMLGNFADAINERSNANDNMVCHFLILEVLFEAD